LLRELNLIVEEGERIFVNTAKIISIQVNETLTYFAHVAFDSFFLVEDLNFCPERTLKLDGSKQEDLLAGIEAHIEENQ